MPTTEYNPVKEFRTGVYKPVEQFLEEKTFVIVSDSDMRYHLIRFGLTIEEFKENFTNMGYRWINNKDLPEYRKIKQEWAINIKAKMLSANYNFAYQAFYTGLLNFEPWSIAHKGVSQRKKRLLLEDWQLKPRDLKFNIALREAFEQAILDREKECREFYQTLEKAGED